MGHPSVLQRREAFRAHPLPHTAPVALQLDGLPLPVGGHVLDLSSGGMLVALTCRHHVTVRSIAPGLPAVAYLAFLDPSQAWDALPGTCKGVPAVRARVIWRELRNTRSELRVALAFEAPDPPLRLRLARYIQDCDRDTLRIRRPTSGCR